ncbi:MAG: transposase [Flavobacteriaceae bacterium]|nr:transposase [Flavobacteriaceae bacterium]
MKNRKRNRMLGYDYSKDNLYFITICVQNKRCCFGNVVREGNEASTRELTVIQNHENQNQLSFNNHYKSIQMQLNEYGSIAQKQWQWLGEQYSYVKLHSFIIMPNHVHGIIEINRNLVSDNSVKIKSISELIGAFKTTTSKKIHLAGFTDFSWQRSFHDNIIRNKAAYNRISTYIETNADRWKGIVIEKQFDSKKFIDLKEL